MHKTHLLKLMFWSFFDSTNQAMFLEKAIIKCYRQRYVCLICGQQFDDLSSAIFEAHHRPSTPGWCVYIGWV